MILPRREADSHRRNSLANSISVPTVTPAHAAMARTISVNPSRTGVYRLSDAERAAVREGIDAADVGHFAPENEMEEYYRLHRGV
jgi:predicted transcriptional regulator